MMHCITGGDLNLPYAYWNGNAECASGAEAFINRLAWENGYTQVADCPNLRDALLDVYLVWPETSFNSCSIVQGISDHCRVLLEVEWKENCDKPQEERLVPVYSKTTDLKLQIFLWNKFVTWASNGSCVEEIWNNFKVTAFESIKYFVTHKILRKNSDPKYYNKEVLRLKLKLR
jgi:hypothetical protein